MKQMTKAERIFRDTWLDCRKHIRDWGYETTEDGAAIGFNRVSSRDDEAVCNRTLNAMSKLIEKKVVDAGRFVRMNIWNKERYTEELQILAMMQATIGNTRKAIA